MSTLAVDAPVVELQGYRNSIGIIATDIVYEGAMVGENGAGYGQPLVAGNKFLGHSIEKVDNTSGAAGDLNIEMRAGHYRMKVALVIAITDVGQPVYASDDAVLTMIAAAAAAVHSYVGVVTRYINATHCEVEFRPGECDEFGPNENRILKINDYTTDAADNGKIIYLGTKAKTITLLATVLGYKITVVFCGAGGTVDDKEIAVDFADLDLNMGGCGMAAGADGKKLTNTKATSKRGDFLQFIGDGTLGYNLVNKRGTWAQEAP